MDRIENGEGRDFLAKMISDRNSGSHEPVDKTLHQTKKRVQKRKDDKNMRDKKEAKRRETATAVKALAMHT